MFINNRLVFKVNWESLDQLRSERLESIKEKPNIFTLEVCRELILKVDKALEDIQHDLYWSPEDSASFKDRFEKITPSKELTSKYKELVAETKKLKEKEQLMMSLRSELIRNRVNNDMIEELREMDEQLEIEILVLFMKELMQR